MTDLARAVAVTAAVLHYHHPELRPGQAAYIALRKHNPHKSHQIHGTPADPYTLNEHLPAFWNALNKETP